MFEIGNIDNHFLDFCILADCDILIASSSTFVVCAVFLGKENKKVIHSREWIDKNINHFPWHMTKDPEEVRQSQLNFDNFWIQLCNGGNKFYNIWRIV
mgnify:FL=1